MNEIVENTRFSLICPLSEVRSFVEEMENDNIRSAFRSALPPFKTFEKPKPMNLFHKNNFDDENKINKIIDEIKLLVK